MSNADDNSNLPAIDVILPVYREEDDVDRIVDALLAHATAHADVRFTLVDDGSPDRTAARMEHRLADVAPERVRLLAYKPNRGKGHAIQYAMQRSTAPLVMFMDGDLAYSLDHIALIRNALANHDVVIGSRWLADNREANRRSFLRRTLGESFNFMARVMCGLHYADTQAGLKGFRRAAADDIFTRLSIYRYAFDVEVLYIAKRHGYAIGEIAARVSPRHAVQPTSMNLIRDPVKMFGDLVKIRWNALRGRYR